MRALSSMLCLSILVVMTASARAQEATLCRAHEEVYFSCPVGQKIISLCASGNVSPKNGYIKYRFGAPDRLEFEYPAGSISPDGVFSISDIYGGNLNFVHVKFKSGDYDYVVYQGFPSGVYVRKRGGLISNFICDEGSYRQLSQRVFRGIRTVPPVAGVDD